jgi:hypothetical protein
LLNQTQSQLACDSCPHFQAKRLNKAKMQALFAIQHPLRSFPVDKKINEKTTKVETKWSEPPAGDLLKNAPIQITPVMRRSSKIRGC